MKPSPKPPRLKDELFLSVLSSSIVLDFKHGHQKWTMTQLSRASGVSRTLLYYYFGKSKEGILLAAVNLLGQELAGFGNEKMGYWAQGRIAEALQSSRKFLQRIPNLPAFYYQHRGDPTPIGDAIREIEKRHRQKIAKFFPELDATTVDAIFALFMGLSFSPLRSSAAVESGVSIVQRGLHR